MAPVINEFKDDSGRVNINEWRHDIIARLIIDSENGAEGLTTRELCMIYFGYIDLEMKIWMGDQLQAVRQMVQERPIPMFLLSHWYRWYIVPAKDAASARGFIVDRAKRFIRSHSRLRRYSDIGQKTYALPSGDPLLKAIEGVAPNVRQIESAVALSEPKDPDNGQE